MGDVVNGMAKALKMTLYGISENGGVPPVTDAEIAAFLSRLTCSPARKELMRAALSLVGRVPYFWGGKSAPGWNDEWGVPKLVTSVGSSSTGTLRPYGLDCSGFTDWVYKTALGRSLPVGSRGQWDNSAAVPEAELLPGDLGFLDEPGMVAVNHVLLYAGTDEDGKKLWVHCASGASGVTLDSPTYVKYYRRVMTGTTGGLP
jgi:cell wall-associated NlpC family hydrolase